MLKFSATIPLPVAIDQVTFIFLSISLNCETLNTIVIIIIIIILNQIECHYHHYCHYQHQIEWDDESGEVMIGTIPHIKVAA